MSKLNILEFADSLKPWEVPLKRPSIPVFPEYRELAPHSVETYGPWPSLFSFHAPILPEVLELKDGIIPALFFLKQHPELDSKRCYFSPRLAGLLPGNWREANFSYLLAPVAEAKLAYIEFYDGISSISTFQERLTSLPATVTSLVLDLRLNSAREESDAGRVMQLIRSLPATLKLITVDELVQQSASGTSCVFHFETLLVGSSFLEEQILIQGGGLHQSLVPVGTQVAGYSLTPQAQKVIYRQELKQTDPMLKKELFKIVKSAHTLKELLRPQTLRVIGEMVREMEKTYD